MEHSGVLLSTYGDDVDQSHDTQSSAGHLTDFHFQGFPQHLIPAAEYNLRNPEDFAQGPQGQIDASNIVCESCGKPVKTKSELE